MRQNKRLFFNILPVIALCILGLTSCIKEYDPRINSAEQSRYVVMGHITDDGQMQTVSVSLSSPAENPKYIPVAGCRVTVQDNSGNLYAFADSSNGNYVTEITTDKFTDGTSFKLEVITPDGEKIVSDYDKYYRVPEVDSVYFIREDIESSTPGIFTKGIRFYVDLKANNVNARNFMWEAVETWEYHVAYPVEWYYDGEIHHVFPPDSTNLVCWMTRQVPYIYTLSTRNLSQNEFKKFPLQFVDNRTNRLLIGYSLLVKQYSLSDSAYRYWDEMRINSVEQGGLFTKQPLSINGNLHLEGKPGEKVLGAFTVSSVREKRIFIRQVPNLPIEVESTCNPAPLRRGLREISPYDYPAYLMGDELGYQLIVLSENCVNCQIAGGKNTKPNFWPW